MSEYMPHKNSPQSTMQPETLVYIFFTLLAYTPKYAAIWHMNVPLYCYCSPHIDPTLHHMQVKTNYNSYLPYYCHICASNKYAPKMLHISHIWKLVHMHIGINYVSIYVSYELTAINSMTTCTGIHSLHITMICPQQIFLPQYIYVFHYTATVVYI